MVARHLTVDAQSLWVGSDSGRVTRIDMAINTVTGTFQVSGPAPAVAVGYRAAWIVDTDPRGPAARPARVGNPSAIG